MRISSPLLRSGATVAAVAALPVALAAGPALAGPGISVSTTGTTVSVKTTACAQLNGSWGTASLLTSSQRDFAEGRQVALSGSASGQSAAWSGITPGTYTVIVMCSNNSTAGTQTVIVSSAPSPSPSRSAAPSPSASPGGVMGGLGGAVQDYGTATLVAGGALVGTGVIAAAWFLRRRSKPYRF
ncbi:hypothetical protein RVN83_03605 [Streptomyces sp. PU10]|uniref:hypothetical protein n=1 Tax=Streptomyces TaxID=1883 RepID=UPI001431911C|nr:MULTISPECIES: hypothetical protein [Streptomyces]WSU05246.1 hypothetical protein OG368_33405 [Streptomyces sp. NBC_01124]MBH5133725.1 hypothetical protein [Streptomyces sp. HB-N217]MCQ4205284.1 hypothetical protein [Streptomyces coelicoflavus]MDU0252384.1 hypothetical protein [Streptomyces sp. PU10]QKW64859.1 hypothetical protein HUT15_32315 [Streptomyces sp. NA03103]